MKTKMQIFKYLTLTHPSSNCNSHLSCIKAPHTHTQCLLYQNFYRHLQDRETVGESHLLYFCRPRKRDIMRGKSNIFM